MKTGQIIGGLLLATGVGALIYYGFRKNLNTQASRASASTDATNKGTTQTTNKTQPSGSGIMDSTTNPNADLGLISAPKGQSYPSTGFKNAIEGNAFRVWFNNSFPKTAKNIDLDRSGSYDNDYIRKAYALKGMEYNAYLKTQDGIAFAKKYAIFKFKP